MSTKVVFKTRGQLDLRAITHMGINAKPNNNSPIGFFGTGLKYAIAVLMREGCKVQIIIGKDVYDFSTESKEFRGKKFGMIYMSRPSWLGLKKVETELSYTTELGKTWKLWQAFRELHSNTLDENGGTYLEEGEVPAGGREAFTYITVEGREFVEEYHDMGNTFHPLASRNRTDSVTVEYFPESSKHVYYRGMRVMDLDKPAIHTYNILTKIDLTEDRTAKYPHEVERLIREYVTSLEDAAVIKTILKAPEGTYEQKLDFTSYHYTTPKQAFIDTAREFRKTSTNHTVSHFIERYDPPAVVAPIEPPYLSHIKEMLKEECWDDATNLLLNQDKAIIGELNDAGF